MDAPNQSSPMKLALRCTTGLSIMVGSMFTVMLLPAKVLRPSGTAPCSDSTCVCTALFSSMLLTWLALLIGGAVIATRAEGRLKRGVRDEIWQEDQLAPMRAWVDRPLAKAVAFLPILGWGGCLIADHRSALFGMLLLFLQPTLTLSRWSALLTPVQRGLVQDWHTWKPFQSEHWGERHAPGENIMR